MGEPRGSDPKSEALRKQGIFNPTPAQVLDELFLGSDFFDPRDLVQVKYEMLRRSREEGWSVTQASSTFGLSRPSFYKARADFDMEGVAGLVPRKRGPRGAHKLTDEVVEYLEQLLAGGEELNSEAMAQRVLERFNLKVHRRSIERALARSKKKRQ
jgi:transposase